MAYPWTVYKTWSTGEILTAADLNSSFATAISNSIPTSIDDASANVAGMQATEDPGEQGSESLATTLSGELLRLRKLIAETTGKTYWYESPSASIENILTGTTTFAGPKTFTGTADMVRLGIGESAPERPLHIKLASAGTISAQAQSAIVLENSTTCLIEFQLPNNIAGGLTFSDPDAVRIGELKYSHTDNSWRFTANAIDDLLVVQSTGVALKGTTTNNSASTGYVGEYVSSIQNSSQNAGSTGQYANITTVSLTAGDWDVTGVIQNLHNGATFSDTSFGAISAESANSTGDHVNNSNVVRAQVLPTASIDAVIVIPSYRVSIASTTTIYLKGAANYSAGTPQFRGRISARRVR